jgi:hypothetical protein
MKKIFFFTFSLLVTAFFYQSCKPVDNTKAMMQSDSIADSKLMMLRDSLHMACMTDVMNAAKMKADSMMQAYLHPAKGSKAKPPAPPAPPANPKDQKMQGGTNTQDKKDKMSGASDSTATQKKKDKMKGAQPPK